MPDRQGKKRKPKSSSSSSQAKRSGQPGNRVWIDPELCRSSESEPEEYGDLHGQERWEIDGVVDSHCGENDRMSYKLRWDKSDWQRADGTSEEWIPAPKDSHSEHNQFIKEYEARELSKHDPSRFPAANMETLHSFLTLPPGSSKNLWLQADILSTLAMHQAASKLAGSPETIPKFQVEDHDFVSFDFELDSGSEDEAHTQAPGNPFQVKDERAVSPSLGGSPTRNSQFLPTPITLLQKLENAWNEEAAKVGAAPITLTNDIDSNIPQLKHKFVYSEMELHWSSDVEGFPPDPDMFASCHCKDECSRPHACGCQDPLFETNTPAPRALHSFAYNSNGHFKLKFEGVSIECNARCRCTRACPNRVVQRPRSVHIEIFKTEIRGWAVRSRNTIRRGQVLGSFTGEIITRDNASNLKRDIAAVEMATERKVKFRDRNRYLFDLDAKHSLYTLDCWRVGNWTRFINHKCQPNLKIFPVCYDTLPDTGLERLAVVALRDIPAGEELTIDYNPGHDLSGDSSSQTTYREFSNCLCGSQNCRGLIHV